MQLHYCCGFVKCLSITTHCILCRTFVILPRACKISRISLSAWFSLWAVAQLEFYIEGHNARNKQRLSRLAKAKCTVGVTISVIVYQISSSVALIMLLDEWASSPLHLNVAAAFCYKCKQTRAILNCLHTHMCTHTHISTCITHTYLHVCNSQT